MRQAIANRHRDACQDRATASCDRHLKTERLLPSATPPWHLGNPRPAGPGRALPGSAQRPLPRSIGSADRGTRHRSSCPSSSARWRKERPGGPASAWPRRTPGRWHGRVSNAQLAAQHLDQYARPDPTALALLQKSAARLSWSGRSYHRVLHVARSIAALSGDADIAAGHMAEAVQLRRGLGAGTV